MDDIDFDLDDLGDLEDLDCDWESTLESIGFDPPSGNELVFRQQPPNGHHPNNNNDPYRSPSVVNERSPAASTPNKESPYNSNDEALIRLDREREGRCPDCGAQTHQIQMDASGSGRPVKIPLSVPGEVHRGRCLFCHPLPTNHMASMGNSRRPQSQNEPRAKRQMEPAPTLEDLHNMARNRGFDNNVDTHEYNREESSASVCTVNSQQSNHSAYSQHSLQSAPVNWNTEQFQLMEQQRQLQQQQQQQQQQQFADDSSQASYHSNVSHQSHATYNSFVQHGQQQQFAAPLHNDNRRISAQLNNNDYNPVVEKVLVQLQDDSLNSESVLQFMRKFPAHPLIQERGCAIIWVQTYNADMCLALSNMGGVSTVLEAMRNHPHIQRLQRAACEALRNLCVLPINRQVILNQGGIAILVDAMQIHSKDPQIQRSGCTALACVAEGGIEYKIGVAESGGILAVMKAVESHPENDLVLRAAYQALRMLGYNPGAR